jgi:hypothetical protein
LAPLVDFEVHPLVEANDGFERALAMIERAAEQMSQA